MWKLSGKFHFLLRFCTLNWSETYIWCLIREIHLRCHTFWPFGGSSHLTITNDTLDLIIQKPPWPIPLLKNLRFPQAAVRILLKCDLGVFVNHALLNAWNMYKSWRYSLNIHHICLHQVRIRLPTLALKPRNDVTRSPKQGYQWPFKRICVHQKNFFKKKNECLCSSYILIDFDHLGRLMPRWIQKFVWRRRCAHPPGAYLQTFPFSEFSKKNSCNRENFGLNRTKDTGSELPTKDPKM